MAKVFKIMVPDNSLISRTLYNESLSTELYVIDRADKKFISDHSEDLSKPALYILANRDEKKLYVGQTGDSLARLHNHKSKEFWTEAIVFHSNPGTDTLSTTEVEWLEAKTYETIKELGYYDLSENTQKPKYPRLKRDQEINCPEYFETAKNYICAAGFDFFIKQMGTQQEEPKEPEPQTTQSGEKWLICYDSKYFDVAGCFKKYGQVYWRHKAGIQNVQKGDTVYLYGANPEGAVRFKAEVVDSQIHYSKEMDVEDEFDGSGGDNSSHKDSKFFLVRYVAETNNPALKYAEMIKSGVIGKRPSATRISQMQFKALREYIEEHFDETSKTQRATPAKPESDKQKIWMIPANPKYFNHRACFEELGGIYWSQYFKYQVGDIVYIYLSHSIQKVVFKCEVVESGLPFNARVEAQKKFFHNPEDMEKGKRNNRYVLLKRIDESTSNKLTQARLLSHGMKKAPQGALILSDDSNSELLKYIEENF